MTPRIEWIDRTPALVAAVEQIGDGPLCVDSEADSLHHYPEKVCLVQLSFADRHFLIDPLAGVDLGRLGPALADRGIRKILHGADYDLRVLDRDFGLRIAGLFDTMVAARLVGEKSFGLAALLKSHFDVTLDKRFQRADWSTRPLPEPMRDYASLDTRFLQPLAELLQTRLESLGRMAWADEEFRRLEQVRWSEAVDPESFRRVKGSGTLHRQELAVLREIYELRERRAREVDRPPFKVLSQEKLLTLARAKPASGPAVREIEGLPRSWHRSPRCDELVRCVERALALPEDQQPSVRRNARKRRSSGFLARAAKLREQRDRLARQLALEPSLLLPRAVLEEVIERRQDGRELATIPDLRAWQLDLLRPLLAVPGGERP